MPDAIVDAPDREGAVRVLTQLLDASTLGAEAVMGMSLQQLTVDERRANQAELEDLDQQLTFTLSDRPGSTGENLTLRPSSGTTDGDIFGARTEEIGSAGDGSGNPAGALDEEIALATERVRVEEAAWYVAEELTSDGPQKVGLVFGELVDGEVSVRIWIHPEHCKKGYGTAALRKSRSEMASAFPGVPMVVRAPGAPA